MNAEDALATIKDVEKIGDMGKKEDNSKGQKRERPDHRPSDENKRKDKRIPQIVMLVDKILVQIRDKHYLKWPRLLHSSPHIHDEKKYCQFHKDHGHNMEDCQDLKEQIEELIQRRKLQEYVKKGETSRFRNNNKSQCEPSPRDKDHTSQRPPSVIEEIKTITGGPSTGGSFRSLRKTYQRQVNNAHRIPPFK